MFRRVIRRHRKPLLIGGGFLLYFVVVNLGALVFFNARAFPRTTIGGQKVGSKTFSQLTSSLQASTVSNDSLTIAYDDKKEQLPLSQLDATIDTQKTLANLRHERSWLPILNVARQHQLGRPSVLAHEDKVAAEAERLATTATHAATNAKIDIQNGVFVLVPSQDGTKADKDTIRQLLVQTLQDGHKEVTLQQAKEAPVRKTADLEPDYQSLRKQQETPVTVVYQQKTVTVTPQVIAGWYSPQSDSFVLNNGLVKAYVQKQGSSWGIFVDNADAATTEIAKALASNQKVNVTLVARKVVKQYTYCVAARGVDPSYLGEFGAKFSAVLNDGRGWSVSGTVGFSQGSSGCSFTAWLSAAGSMPSFGAICDSLWSCQVGSNVVINFDRWQGASAAWNASGGNLQDYRVMVINHETGHWLGFGHSGCGGAGQPAPVMQQQSIDLAGCIFNPWPLPSEIASLRGRLGLP